MLLRIPLGLTSGVHHKYSIHSSCNELDDGLRYIKPSSSNVVIPAYCSKVFTVLTPSINLKSYLEFFKSLELLTTTIFGVAVDCNTCTASKVQPSIKKSVWTASVDL